MNEDILALVGDDDFVTSDFIDIILNRLKSLGYTVAETEAEVYLIAFTIQKVKNTVKNECNITSIPEGLTYVIADMICGEILMSKLKTNSLGNSYSIDSAMKSVKLGDTTVQLDGDSDEDKLYYLFNYLINYGWEQLICFRKIKW